MCSKEAVVKMQVWFLCFALRETKGDRSEPPFPHNSFLNQFILNFFFLNTPWRFQTTGFVFLLLCFHFAPRAAPDSLAPLGTPTRILITVWATSCERLRAGNDGWNWNQNSWATATARATAATGSNKNRRPSYNGCSLTALDRSPEAAWHDPSRIPHKRKEKCMDSPGTRRSLWGVRPSWSYTWG